MFTDIKSNTYLKTPGKTELPIPIKPEKIIDTKTEISKKRSAPEAAKDDNVRSTKKIASEEKLSDEKKEKEKVIEPPVSKVKDKKRPREDKS